MTLTISSRFRGLALLGALCLPMPASGETAPVTLRALDGGVTVTGELKSFDGTTYTVATLLGEMVLEADQVACEGTACPSAPLSDPDRDLAIAVGDDLAPSLVPLLVESFAAKTGGSLVRALDGSGNLTFRLNGPTTARVRTLPQKPGFAFSAMSEGSAGITLTRQIPGSDVVATTQASGMGRLDDPANQRIVGLDALTVVVSPANPVRALSPAVIADIFSGRIANWSALGGPNAPIHPVMPEASLSLSERITTRVLNGATVSAATQRASTPAGVSDIVTADRYAIGLTTFANMRGAAPVALHTECGLTIAPTQAAILTEAYPFAERIVAYTTDGTPASAQSEFAEFLTSDAAQDAVSDAGFVGQRISSLSLDAQGQRFVSAMLRSTRRGQADVLREFLRAVEQADRLTPTFRFLPGGAQLDHKAIADAARLADYIASRDLTNREILFVGFTDSVGSTQRNRKLSRLRAELVKNEVLARLDAETRAAVSTDVLGFGEIAPVACDDTAYGQDANRRVEIWLRPREVRSQ